MYAAFGCSALALHVASVCIHIVNAWLVMLLGREISRTPDCPSGRPAFAVLSGILFAVQPGPAQAALWPSAVGTLLSATFGLLFLLIDSSSRAFAALVYAAAMGSHESGIMWLPAAGLIRYGMRDRSITRALARHYGPAFFLLIVYVLLTAWINSHNYVVTEGQYRPGTHVLTNLLMYLVALYAGHQRWIEYVAVVVLIVAGLWRGTPFVRACCLWLIASLTPMLAFTTGPASRYLYVPAIPFSLLIAAGIMWFARIIRERAPVRSAAIAWSVALLQTAFIAGRSAVFARKGADGFH